ncbi:hypothetical protein BN2476_490063 [Paraburkholderia piptadeniae]|uniref:Uncharacterized protein n=1 Tax=Paraburkholderia piptadeniae TaxID=1701573 RepID=A0A1N7SF13_9BURK|nr:hypothetical protein BN2476_490063 [Paraburkholderia piptadeniae]
MVWRYGPAPYAMPVEPGRLDITDPRIEQNPRASRRWPGRRAAESGVAVEILKRRGPRHEGDLVIEVAPSPVC